MIAVIESDDHLYELRAEAIGAEGHHCPECHDVAAGDRLFIFSTVRGNKVRVHDGAFCSQQCHDVWYGVAPKKN
jgi:hypothetical protein